MRNSIEGSVGTETTIGVDLGDRNSHCCVLDSGGEVVEESTIQTTPRAVRRWFSAREPARVVLEAGTHSHWASRLLSELGHDVIVANPRLLRFIYGNDSKNDRADADYLARVGRLDPSLLRPIAHRSEARQADRALLRSREALVRSRAHLITHIRAAVKVFGGRLPRCSTDYFARKTEALIPDILRPALEPVLAVIDSLTSQILEIERKIERLARDTYPETALLVQVSGVGTLTALAFVLTVEDPQRFRRCRSVGSYFGLRPRQQDSGDQQPQLHITKAGDRMMRSLLVECAHHTLGALGADSDLRRWGLKLAERGGKNAKKRAAVAVARKLSVLLLRLWTTGEVYDPLRNTRRRDQLLPTPA